MEPRSAFQRKLRQDIGIQAKPSTKHAYASNDFSRRYISISNFCSFFTLICLPVLSLFFNIDRWKPEYTQIRSPAPQLHAGREAVDSARAWVR